MTSATYHVTIIRRLRFWNAMQTGFLLAAGVIWLTEMLVGR
jgi:hypothetical protein